MSIAATADDTLDAQPHKQQVGQGVDNLGGVNGRIVVLDERCQSQTSGINKETKRTYLLTPVESRSNRTPESSLTRRIWDEGQRPHFVDCRCCEEEGRSREGDVDYTRFD